jgi:hypothetical protein
VTRDDEELELAVPIDPEDCGHPGRPPVPREGSSSSSVWYCSTCDTSFVASELFERVWREL